MPNDLAASFSIFPRRPTVEPKIADLQQKEVVKSAVTSAASAADCELPAGIPRTTSNKVYLDWLMQRIKRTE